MLMEKVVKICRVSDCRAATWPDPTRALDETEKKYIYARI